MKKIIISLILLIIFSTTAFAECETTVNKIERFDVTYNILEDGTSEATFVVVANFPRNCLIDRYKNDLNIEEDEELIIEIPYEDFTCPKEFILNNINAEFGNFPNGLSCSASFTSDENTIRMNFTGVSSFFGKEKDDLIEINIGGSNFTRNLTNDSSLTITIPSIANFISYSPKSGTKLVNKLYFSPIPKEEVIINYSIIPKDNLFENNLEEFFNATLIGIAGVAILITVLGIFVLRKKDKVIVKEVPKKVEKDNSKELEEKIIDIKEKIKSLQKSYLKGQVEENTYERLIEQYQLELNNLKVELKKKN